MIVDVGSPNCFDPHTGKPAPIDWGSAAAMVEAAILRTGEGLHDDDETFAANVLGCTSAGIPYAVYRVIAPSSGNPEGQAQRMFDMCGGAVVRPWVDVERNTPLSNTEAIDWVAKLRRMVEKASELFNMPCGVYTYSGFLADSLWRGGLQGPEWNQWPLWCAQYSPVPPRLIAPWTSWTLWQCSSSATCPGIVTHVDRSALAPGVTLADAFGLLRPSAQIERPA